MNEKLETKDKVAKLTDRVNKLTEMEHIDFLENKFLPKVKEACDTMDQHRKEFIEMKECICGFD